MSCVCDTNESDGEALVMQELLGMCRTLLLPLLPGLLHLGLVAPDRVLSMVQIELFDILTAYKQIMRNWIVWNSTVRAFNYV